MTDLMGKVGSEMAGESYARRGGVGLYYLILVSIGPVQYRKQLFVGPS